MIQVTCPSIPASSLSAVLVGNLSGIGSMHHTLLRIIVTSEIPLVDVMLPQGQPDPDPCHGKAGYLVEYLDIASFFKEPGEDPAAV